MNYESSKVSNSNNFHWEESAFHVYGEGDREVIALMANRFIGQNPQAPYQYRLDFTSGITCDTKGWYQFDFGSRFSQADVGEVCCGAGDLYSHSQTLSQFQIQCCGPTVCWVNGEKVFHSAPPQESFKSCCTFSIPLQTGLNHFLLETEKTELGFGLLLRHAQPQWQPSHFTAPLAERKGQAGFIYSPPASRESVDASALISGSYEGLSWFPGQQYEEPVSSCPLSRVFGPDSQGTAAAKSSFFHGDSGKILIKGRSSQPLKIYINGVLSLEWVEGAFEKEVSLPIGRHQVILLCEKKAGKETGLVIEFQDGSGLWHQILDDPSTYEESSSTSMFICALSRGIRLGILNPGLRRESISAIHRAWKGMKQRVISRRGDLYGVCQGSGCSFSRSYYQQLGWRFNDPHGIGIAILAGVEKLMLDEFLQQG
ncbi:glycoside hydrolase family 88 protein [Lacrimispora brassicae]